MKKVFELIPEKWYNIKYLKLGAKSGYHGPAKFIGKGAGLLAFVLPEHLHLLGSDGEDVDISYFMAKDVVSEYQGETPMGYFELVEEVKRLKGIIEELTNEYDNDIQSLKQELEANRH